MASRMPRILLVDNYDSFTYNVRELLCQVAGYGTVDLVKNDLVEIPSALNYDAWVISPGPGLPHGSGQLMDLIAMGVERVPILGICLGHQAIAEHFGGELFNLGEVKHGRQVRIRWTADAPIRPDDHDEWMEVGLYHSWAVDRGSLPEALQLIAEDEDGIPMAIRHREYPVYGVQFHPESVLTPLGIEIFSRFLASAFSAPLSSPDHS